MARSFNTVSRDVVHEACEAMRLGKQFGPHLISDSAGDWKASGNVLRIEQLPGRDYCFAITVSEWRHSDPDPTSHV